MGDNERAYRKMLLNSMYGSKIDVVYKYYDSIEEVLTERNRVNRNETIDKILKDE